MPTSHNAFLYYIHKCYNLLYILVKKNCVMACGTKNGTCYVDKYDWLFKVVSFVVDSEIEDKLP